MKTDNTGPGTRDGGTMKSSKGTTIAYWIFTSLFILQIGFTAYAQLFLPQVAQMFTHLGFSDAFRVALSFAKIVGVIVLLAPVPRWLKQAAYAGFALTLVAAVIAHLRAGDDVSAWGWAAGTFVLEALSYSFFVRGARRQSAAQPALGEAYRAAP